MRIVVCPGFHAPELTQGFLATLPEPFRTAVLVFPAERLPSYSAPHLLAFLVHHLSASEDLPDEVPSELSELSKVPELLEFPHSFGGLVSAGDPRRVRLATQTPLLLISFSAGVVGAIAAAQIWQVLGGEVWAFLALDGWGVPLSGSFPIHRLSHDAFTHWSSALLGGGSENFYADPAVSHLDLWRAPQTARGWRVQDAGKTATTAAEFVALLLQRYAQTK